MTYRPLPNGLYIGASSIEGQGVYSSRALAKGCQLGETHYRIATNDNPSMHMEENKTILIRTPLGGFINHSDKPNCHRSQVRIKPGFDKWIITVIEDVNPGDELTLKYTMYDPKKV
jgi:hypothetical protein